MGNFTDRLMGEVIEDPDGQERDVEHLLNKLLEALLAEVSAPDRSTPAALKESI